MGVRVTEGYGEEGFIHLIGCVGEGAVAPR